jgi:hypothetical protein
LAQAVEVLVEGGDRHPPASPDSHGVDDTGAEQLIDLGPAIAITSAVSSGVNSNLFILAASRGSGPALSKTLRLVRSGQDRALTVGSAGQRNLAIPSRGYLASMSRHPLLSILSVVAAAAVSFRYTKWFFVRSRWSDWTLLVHPWHGSAGP